MKSAYPTTYYDIMETSQGPLTIVASEKGVQALFWDSKYPSSADWQYDPSFLRKTRQQLTEYFSGQRQNFELPLDPIGTPFQQRVWQELCKIPYGECISYRQLAERVGSPKGYRAVGNANGKNPITIIQPCHRVIASDGTLGGYSAGLDRKRFLLGLESKKPY